MKKFYLALAMVAMLVMFSGCGKAVTVPEGYVGIKVVRGAAQDEVLNPGKHYTNIFTTEVVLMDTRWQKYAAQTSAFSKDIQQVDITVSMSYQIENTGALRLYKEVGKDYADKIAADAEAYRLEMESKYITDAVIQKETVEKWDGKLPSITGTNAVPLIDAGAISLTE